jgi:hypothetical protein
VRRSEAKPSRAAVEAPNSRRSEAKPSRAAVEAPNSRRSEAKASRAAVEAPNSRRSEAKPSRAAVEAPDPARQRGLEIGRRSFLVLGPAAVAAGALAACGSGVEEPSTERDVELLSDALVGEENAASALGLVEAAADDAKAAEVEALREQASTNAAKLQRELERLDATAEGDFEIARDDPPLQTALDETNRAVAAYRAGAGQLSTEPLRQMAIGFATADGARLALLGELLGIDPAPEAFVTGGPGRPFESTSPDEDDETSEDEDEETTTSEKDGP